MASRHLPSHALLGVLASLVLTSVLAVGGAPPSVVLVLGVISAVGIAMSWVEPVEARRPSLLPVLVLALLAGYTALQTVPLSLSWLKSLSPSAADIWSRALLPLGDGVPSGSLSLEPALTATEALKLAIYAATFYLSAVVARKHGVVTCLTLVFAAGIAVALATIAHEVSGAKKVFGFYEPRHLSVYSRIGPLLNTNNLAGYLNLSVLCGLAILQSRRRRLSPWLIGTGVAIIVGVEFRAASRAGLLLLPLGVLLAGAWLLVLRLRARRSDVKKGLWQAYAVIGAAVVLGGILGVIGADPVIWAALVDGGTQKLAIPAMTRPMIEDFGRFGVGRGAFESAFMAYRPAMAAHVTFTHPENLAVQWLTEWGLLPTLVAVVALGWALRPSNLGATRSALNSTAYVAVLVLVAHNFVDLSLELPGVTIAACTVLGGLCGDARVGRTVRDRNPRYERWWRVTAVALVGFLTVLAGMRGPTTLYDDRGTARDAVDASLNDPSRVAAARAVIRAQMLRHPADYYFPQLGAALAFMTRSDNPMPWIQRALERGPTVGRTHLLLAEVLASKGVTRQALLELRYAVEMEPALAKTAASMALAWTRNGDDLLAAVPNGEAGAPMLDHLAARLSSPEDGELRERLDGEALSRSPGLRNPRERLAKARIEAFGKDTAPCWSRVQCEDEILLHGRALSEHHPASSIGKQLEAQLAMKDERVEDARRTLAEACKLPEDMASCLRLFVQIEEDEALPQLVTRYTALSCSDKKACAAAWDFASETYANRKLFAQAQSAAERAAREEPTPARWLKAADLAESANLPGAALEAVLQANRLTGGKDPQIAARLEAVRRVERLK